MSHGGKPVWLMCGIVTCVIVTCFTTSHHVIVIFLESPARRGGHRLWHIVNHVVCARGSDTCVAEQDKNGVLGGF